MYFLSLQRWRRRCTQVLLLRADARSRAHGCTRWVAASYDSGAWCLYRGHRLLPGRDDRYALQAVLTPGMGFDECVREAARFAAPGALWFGLAWLIPSSALMLWKSALRPLKQADRVRCAKQPAQSN